MKKASQELNSIFSVAEEMVKNNGEDCLYHDVNGKDFIIASFDGCGGSGSKKYQNYSGKTGAYVASRAVCGGVKAWFDESRQNSKMIEYIQKALSVCDKYADKSGRIMGSLGKAFPTTATIITGSLKETTVDVNCYWAGDSRCFILDGKGLHQLTADDLDGQDAMSNLSNDGVMTNVINSSSPFNLHIKSITAGYPCVLITATDGCFGYLNSPMEFEHLLIDSLVNSKNMIEWKNSMYNRISEVAGDDFTLCVAVCGFDSFDSMKNSFVGRNKYIINKYIENENDVNDMWNEYKEEYSMYM